MIFNTWAFGLFLLLTVVVYWCLPGKWRHVFLLIASFLFYAYYFPPYTFLILFMALVVYGLSLIMTSRMGRWRKTVFILGIVFCLSFLVYYKYTKMILRTWNELAAVFQGPILSIPDLLVPLGLSFFVFEFVHYLADSYKGKAEKVSITEFGLFAMFFPTLVAGPIKRFQPFIDQLRRIRFSWDHFTVGLQRIVIGIAKKVMIADPMDHFLHPLFKPHSATDAELYAAVLAYAIKIYADFSGYSDIAIGAARLFGYQIPENFLYPYFRRNIAEFWNHWHISLSSWIRDYIYIPLGGSRGTLAFAIRNSLIAMALSGLWHGASWNFVVWGLWHGMGLAGLRIWNYGLKQAGIPKEKLSFLTPFSVLLTFSFVCVGWVFFVVTNLSDAFYIVMRILQMK
ncbi:MBOAT family O-acyltransferase [Effusibacillus consociatus]|uniref:MBOAT family O-acyltransferase n=1 Tax=Effusibacillus consociatus TaxID=1117041 RepID=A0ABV9QA20_9BACL